MGLFNKVFRKEENTGCNCSEKCISKVEDSEERVPTNRFIVLGDCCKKSIETFENTKRAVKELGFEDEVINIGDLSRIASYGVMSTPALVVDGKVVAYGKLLKVEDVKSIIEKSIG